MNRPLAAVLATGSTGGHDELYAKKVEAGTNVAGEVSHRAVASHARTARAAEGRDVKGTELQAAERRRRLDAGRHASGTECGVGGVEREDPQRVGVAYLDRGPHMLLWKSEFTENGCLDR